MTDDKKILSKEEKLEIKKLRNEVKNDLKILKKVRVPEMQVAHLERIIRFYNRIHQINPPSITDKATLNLIKIQYRGLCAIKRIKPQRDIL